MKNYDYAINGKYVDLFHVNSETRKLLKKLKSYKELQYQRCTDRIDLDDFDMFRAAVGGKSTKKSHSAMAWELLKK